VNNAVHPSSFTVARMPSGGRFPICFMTWYGTKWMTAPMAASGAVSAAVSAERPIRRV
jgi:hypothetical protein